MDLGADTLDRLDPGVEVPSYDRQGLAHSIVHVGVGGFHRAHLATYVDELARAGHTAWGIVGAGVLPGDAAMAEALHAQGGLYTLVARGADTVDVRVVGSLVDYVLAHPDPEPLVARIADRDTQVVSLTVTEAGYPVHDVSGEFAPDSPNAQPGSAFDAIVRGLRRRRDAGAGPVTVLSCDNVMGNGAVARTSTLGLAAATDPDLCGWIEARVTFPNSMVDRITPVTTDADRRWVATRIGVDDAWPVMTEPFRQWVIEDDFAAARPPLEELDVIVTDDVAPYERFKLRLLNAGHSCLAYLAGLVEIERVDAVMAEPAFATFLRRFLDEEAGPTVPATPGIELETYKASLVERFANPAIGDQVRRLCLDGSAKFPKFLLPTIRANLARGRPVALSALALAGWCQYLVGTAEGGAPIDLADDPHLAEARRHAQASVADPAAFLRFQRVFGDDLPGDTRFVWAFTDALTSLRERGVRSTLAAWVAREVDTADA